MESKGLAKFIISIAVMLVGLAMSAMAQACFALPYDMVVSGVTGIGRIVNHAFGINITHTVYVLSIGFFILGALVLGKEFAAKVVVGTFAFPVFLQMFQNIDAIQHLVDEPLLAAICAGLLDGVGIGMVIKMGGSTGGIEIPPIILNRKFGWKVSAMLSAEDILILLCQVLFTSTNGVILGILYVIIYSVVLDKVLLLNQGGVQVLTFSSKSEEINEKLLQLGYGTTILKGEGGYLRENRDVVYSVVNNRVLNTVKNAILEIDDDAFITVSSVSEIRGNGFTKRFRDEDYVKDISMRSAGE